MLQPRLMISDLAAPALVRTSSIMPIRIIASRILPPCVAPAIVSASSLLSVSPLEQQVRCIVRIQQVQGGMTKVIGEVPTTLQTIAGQLPWGLYGDGGAVEIHLLRD